MNIIMEVLDVANPNTLIALAYIRVEKNRFYSKASGKPINMV